MGSEATAHRGGRGILTERRVGDHIKLASSISTPVRSGSSGQADSAVRLVGGVRSQLCPLDVLLVKPRSWLLIGLLQIT